MSTKDLQKINGIGPKYAAALVDGGVTSLDELATATPRQLDTIVQAPEWRANYQDWIEQARVLTAASTEVKAVESDASVETQDDAEKIPKNEIQAELAALVAELNDLAEELQRLAPDYQPPTYSPQGMLVLLKSNVQRFTPDSVKDIQGSFEGTTVDDFRDIETWKGMWFTLNYLVQMEVRERRDGLLQRLSVIPGVTTLSDIRTMLADTPPDEFLKIDTWKGMWFVANYEVQNGVRGLRWRVLGADEVSDEEDA